MTMNEYAESIHFDGAIHASMPWEELNPWRYSEHKLCPLCLMEGTQTIIGNESTLCKPHRAEVRERTRQQVAELCEMARRQREPSWIDEQAMGT